MRQARGRWAMPGFCKRQFGPGPDDPGSRLVRVPVPWGYKLRGKCGCVSPYRPETRAAPVWVAVTCRWATAARRSWFAFRGTRVGGERRCGGRDQCFKAGYARLANEVSGAMLPPAAGTHRSDSGGGSMPGLSVLGISGISVRGTCQRPVSWK